MLILKLRNTEAVVGRCSSKYMFLEISQISQENTIFPVKFIKFLGTSFFQKTSPVAASDHKFTRIQACAFCFLRFTLNIAS